MFSFGADGQPGGTGHRRRHRVVGPLTEPFAPPRRARAARLHADRDPGRPGRASAVAAALRRRQSLGRRRPRRATRRSAPPRRRARARRRAGAVDAARRSAYRPTGRRTGSGVAATAASWSAIADDDVLAPRALPARDRGRRRRLRRRAGRRRRDPAVSAERPQRAVRVVLVSGAASAVLAADPLNRVGVTERAPDPP